MKVKDQDDGPGAHPGSWNVQAVCMGRWVLFHGDLRKIRDCSDFDPTTIWRIWDLAKMTRSKRKTIEAEFISKKLLEWQAACVFFRDFKIEIFSTPLL
jgi:hypothetical protein